MVIFEHKKTSPVDIKQFISTGYMRLKKRGNCSSIRLRRIKCSRPVDEEIMCSSFERLLNKEKAEAVIELLEDVGELSEELRKHIMEQTDFRCAGTDKNINVLEGWYVWSE